MRIVITKNGRILIQEINPDVKYKGLLTKQRSLNKTKFFPKKIKFNEVKKKTYGNSAKNIFVPKNKSKNLKIDDVLSDFSSPTSNSKSLCKILNIDPNKRLNMPQSIAERYFSTQGNVMNLDNEEKIYCLMFLSQLINLLKKMFLKWDLIMYIIIYLLFKQ